MPGGMAEGRSSGARTHKIPRPWVGYFSTVALRSKGDPTSLDVERVTSESDSGIDPHKATSIMNVGRSDRFELNGFWWVLALLLLLGVQPLAAVEQTTERITDVASLEQSIGRVKLRGSGSLSGNTQRLNGGLQVRRLFNTPAFVASEARFDQERRLPYDLRRWGGDVGLGWALSETTDLLATYRLDSYKVFNTGANVDPAFRTVAGRSMVSALGLVFQHDSRDDRFYPTMGSRTRGGGELALKGLGGDYNIGRLETDLAFYATPFRARPNGTLLKDVTFVEHLRLGWMTGFGATDTVPFFERYFVGGTTTVRGHRNRWLTPRGLEDQFVGGELQLINNVEARVPVFPHLFNRQLSAAVFFDAGRSFRRFSDIGDFGYGVGAGLRYVVHLWKLQGVLRADEAFSLDHEGDDSTARLHLSFGLPF